MARPVEKLVASPLPEKISDRQWTLLAFPFSPYNTVIAEGAVRSGKTSFAMISFVDWAMNTHNKKNFAVCGYSVTSVKRNIILPYQSLDYVHKKYTIKTNWADGLLTVSNGETENYFYIFGGGNAASYEKVQGITLAGALIDEVVLLDETFVNQVLTRCSIQPAKYYFTCNPGSTSHWFYTNWVTRDFDDTLNYHVLRLHFTFADNPGLSEEYKQQRYAEFPKGSVHYQWYIEGKWVRPDGLVYDNFKAKRNIIKQLPKANQSEWYISVDYGITNPFSALLWRVDAKKAYIADEVYLKSDGTHHYTDDDLYEAIDRLAGNHNIQSIIIDPSATSLKETMRRRGKYGLKNAKNEVLPGIRTTYSMISKGIIKIVGSKCQSGVLKEIEEYSWDDKQKKEAPLKENDHAMDAMRYMAHTILRREYEDIL